MTFWTWCQRESNRTKLVSFYNILVKHGDVGKLTFLGRFDLSTFLSHYSTYYQASANHDCMCSVHWLPDLGLSTQYYLINVKVMQLWFLPSRSGMEIPGQQGRGNFQGDRKYSGEALCSRICCVYSLLFAVSYRKILVMPGNKCRHLFNWCISLIWTKQIVCIIHGRLQVEHLKQCAF